MSTIISPELTNIILTKFNWHNYESIDQFPIWELREALSYTLELDYFINEDQEATVNYIVTAIVNKEFSYRWEALPILLESKIQAKLRSQGRELECFELNIFPTSVQEMCSLISINYKSALKSKIHESNRFIDEYKYFLFLGIIVIYNVIFFNFTFLISSLLFSYLLHFFLQIIEHDYIMHEYIKPKNKFISYIITYLVRLSLGNYERSRASHLHHHRYWNQDLDYHTILINESKIKSLLGANSFVIVRYQTIWQKISEKGLVKLNKMNVLHKFMNDNYFYTMCLLGAMFLICFGFSGFIGFFLTPMVYHIAFGAMPDATMNIVKEQKNLPWLWPLLLRDAWHYQHHIRYKRTEYKKIEELFPGPKILMYLNFEYYIMKLLFRIS